MKVGILGSGSVGRVLGAGFLKYGHVALMGTRDPGKSEVRQWLRENPKAAVGSFADAAHFGDLIVMATLGRAAEQAFTLAGTENLAGKVIMDATNPIADAPPVEGVLQFFTGPNESLAERLQAQAPQARVVKAFNSVGSARMVNPQFEQGTPTMFYCGNSPEAKQQVAGIIREFGWEPFDCGALAAARALEPLCKLWCIPGFLRGQWDHAFKLLER